MIKEEQESSTKVKWSSKTVYAYLYTGYIKDGKPNQHNRYRCANEIKIICAWCGRREVITTEFMEKEEENHIIENLSKSDIITIWNVPEYFEKDQRCNIEGDFNFNGEGCENWDDQVNLLAKRSKKVEDRYNDRIKKLKQIETKELSFKNIDPWCSNKCKSEDGRDLNEVLEESNKELNQLMKERVIPKLIKTLEEYIPIITAKYAYYMQDPKLREHWKQKTSQGTGISVTGLSSIMVWVFLLGLFFALMF